jgi:hypothetical protein
MATKIYISGKISGIENEAPELFAKAEKELQAKGFETVNPMTLNHNHDKSWHSYMKEDVKALCECDEVFMLSNWTDSKGGDYRTYCCHVFRAESSLRSSIIAIGL